MSNASADHALDVIYDCVYHMAMESKFEELDFMLEFLNVPAMPTEYILGVLTATLPCKSKLIKREGFMDRAHDELLKRKEDLPQLFKGLY